MNVKMAGTRVFWAANICFNIRGRICLLQDTLVYLEKSCFRKLISHRTSKLSILPWVTSETSYLDWSIHQGRLGLFGLGRHKQLFTDWPHSNPSINKHDKRWWISVKRELIQIQFSSRLRTEVLPGSPPVWTRTESKRIYLQSITLMQIMDELQSVSKDFKNVLTARPR